MNQNHRDGGLLATSAGNADSGEDAAPRPFAWHPPLFAASAIVMLYAHHFQETPLSDVLAPLLVAVAVGLISLLVLRSVFPTREHAAIAASYVLLLTFFYSSLRSVAEFLLSHWVRYIRERYSLAAWLAAVIVGLVCLRFSKYEKRKVTRFLNILSMMFIVSSAFVIGFSWVSGPAMTEAESPTGGLDDTEDTTLQRPAEPHDVYYLIFDRYANNIVLRSLFDYDNTSFVDRLRDRGFYCATDSWTNYPRTCISMASALNMRYHADPIQSDTVYGRQIKNHRVGRLFKDVGYKYYHIGNFYSPLRFNKNADFNHRVSPFPSEFADAAYFLTPFGRVWPNFWPKPVSELLGIVGDEEPASFLGQAKALREVASEDGPKFVYVHFLPWHNSIPGAPRGATARIPFVNERIIEMVDDILAKSGTPPIIVIQADEGPYISHADDDMDSAMRIRKRTGIISAFYLPGVDPAEKIPSTISPVNSFRLIFKEYFGANICLLDDRTFFWEHESVQQPGTPGPGRFVDVTHIVRGKDADDNEP